MTDSNENTPKDEGVPASGKMTLEQALLAPLDSILKAQLHSARSFLNMLLQLGYPHAPRSGEKKEGNQEETSDPNAQSPDEPYHLEFSLKDDDGQPQLLRVPALALVPISPLAVDSANFELEMSATEINKKSQIRSSERNKADSEKDQGFDHSRRPWFLVDEPLDIRGEITKRQSADSSSQEKSIKINIQVKSIPMPAGLEKLLSTLTNMSELKPLPDKNNDESNN